MEQHGIMAFRMALQPDISKANLFSRFLIGESILMPAVILSGHCDLQSAVHSTPGTSGMSGTFSSSVPSSTKMPLRIMSIVEPSFAIAEIKEIAS